LVSSSSSANRRLRGILDAGAGSFALRTYPHFRHVLARSSSFGSVPQYGAFPLRTAFWVRPASPFHDDDPRPFALISFKSTAPRSDSWHRLGRNFARAYIRAYRRMASGWALLSPLLALSSASVALFQPYPLRRTIPGLPESSTHLPHRVARTHLGATEWNPNAFAPIVRARPRSVFGRPVHLSG
jgi:hypothetical protein